MARLLWRKFDRAYTEFAHRTNPEGFTRFDEVPDLPVTEIAADEVALSVAAAGAPGGARGTGGTGAGPASDVEARGADPVGTTTTGSGSSSRGTPSWPGPRSDAWRSSSRR